MAIKFRDFKISKYVSLTWVLLALLVCGAGLHYIQMRWLCQWELLGRFADAMLIAGFLGLVFELFATKKLIEKVSLDVAGRVAGWGLPEKMQTLIREVVNTHIAREHFTKSYSFSDPDEYGSVVIEATIHYTAQNYSGAPQPFQPSIQEEVFYLPEFTHVEYGYPNERPKVLSLSEISSYTSVDDITKVKSLFAPAIQLAGDKHNTRSACNVRIQYRVKMRDQYSDVTAFGGATDGATLEVARLPNTLNFVSGGDKFAVHSEGSSTWYFDRPFINGQHIRAWWFRNDSKS